MLIVEPQYRYYLQASDEVCFINGAEQITRKQLLSVITRYARLYAVSPGDRVVIMAENRPDWAAALFSAWKNRAVGVPVDAMASAEDVAYILKDCEPEAIFCSDKTMETACQAIEMSGLTPILLNLDKLTPNWEDESDVSPMPEHRDEDLALLIYTSGTTSAAKGCMLTFDNLECNYKCMTEDVPIWLPNQTTLAMLPFHHILPLQGCLIMPLHTPGTKIVFCPSLNGPDIIQALHDNHVTIFIAVPRVFQLFRDALLKKINANPIAKMLYALSKAVGNIKFSRFLFRKVQNAFGGSIRYFPTGGAALDYSVYDDLAALGFELLPGSGMSEASPTVAFTRPGKPKRDSAGQVCTCNECKIAEDGEILLRGQNIIKSYWRKPEETAAAFEPDGWFHTGDLGFLDEENYLFYTGRKKELIILSNGKNVPPLVIEEKLQQQSNLIAEIAVIGKGDVLNAIILPDFKACAAAKIVNISETIRQDVIAKYNQKTEPYMRILKCSFVSSPFPRTRLGKLQRHKLSQIVESATDDAKRVETPEPDLPEYRVIRDFLKEEQGCTAVHPDDHFEIDLGIDSLAKVSMLVFLNESFEAELTEEMLADHPTPASLAQFLHEKHGSSGAKIAKFNWKNILNEEVKVMLPTCAWTHPVMVNSFRWLVQNLFFRVKSEGKENIPAGPCIFACNHQSYLDGAFLMTQFDSKTLKNTFFYAKQGHVSSRYAQGMASRHNVIVVDVNSDIKGSLQKLAEVLRSGRKVTIFPEGTRTHDGKTGVFKNTFAILAKEMNVPIVPVVLDGLYEVLPRGHVFPKLFRSIRISFLPAFLPEEKDSYAEIASRTADMINRKLPERP